MISVTRRALVTTCTIVHDLLDNIVVFKHLGDLIAGPGVVLTVYAQR